MTELFKQYIDQKHLVSDYDRILLAVSGGIDSMVMLHLFLRGNHNIGVAHCNFRLRGKESDKDQNFIEQECQKHNIRLYKKSFDTSAYAAERGISIQMAARELRYEWFEEIRSANSFDIVATGHNLNDSVETILINLSRGTGINGLSGIKEKSGHIIRPLLFATREMINEYAGKNAVEYREDSSNKQAKYTRNKIRHKIIPVLQQINPSVLHSIAETSEYLKSANSIYRQAIETKRDLLVRYTGSSALIEINEIKKLEPLEAWVYELFKEWGFGRGQVHDIIRIIDASSGKQLFSDTHIITKDRGSIIISPGDPEERKDIIIRSKADFDTAGRVVEKASLIPGKDFSLIKDPAFACLDADLINYPLIIRNWMEGDYFYPLGMQGRKKVSDLLIDMKIPVPDKKNICILEMDGDIIWVIGIRIDKRFRVSDSTEEVLLLKGEKA
ncbi:MAG: tRNA lysidine(34) synthetase TilS [Bacteroidales bacterium]|nr:tRNA lysidine(34) synthetase TilS [Bacteroidales bacterium]